MRTTTILLFLLLLPAVRASAQRLADASGQSSPTLPGAVAVEIVSQGWTDDEWRNSIRTTDYYDTSGFRYAWLYEKWEDDKGQWLNVWRRAFTADAATRTSEWIEETWDTLYGVWNTSFRQLQQFTAGGRLESDTLWQAYLRWWIPYRLTTYSYDSAGNRIESLKRRWSDTAGWTPDERAVFEHNAEGAMTSETHFKWKASEGRWEPQLINLRTYTAGGMLAQITDQSWTNDEWLNVFRVTYTYVGGLVMTQLHERWKRPDNVWERRHRTYYEYGADDSLDRALRTIWNPGDSSWRNLSRSIYRRTVSSVEAVPPATALVAYPNPVSGRFIVEVPEHATNGRVMVEVTDLAGRMVLNVPATAPQLHLELPPVAGAYVVRLMNNGVVMAMTKVVAIGER